MLRIGDFSQLAQVSVPTLRHYDELGLLKPATVDKFTDYRYYTIDQLPRLNRILALRDLGLSLDQIRRVLSEDVPAAQLRSMLSAKQNDIARQIGEEQARLQRVEARLRQIEHEGEASPYDVVLKKVEAMTVAGVRQLVPHVSQMDENRSWVLRDLYTRLRAYGVNDTGLEIMLYHNTEYSDDDINMEAAIVLGKQAIKSLASSTLADTPINTHDLPGTNTMASTIHNGTMYDIPQAIIAVFAWIGNNGYRSAGPIRELHLFGSETAILSPEDACMPRVIEIQIPVEQA